MKPPYRTDFLGFCVLAARLFTPYHVALFDFIMDSSVLEIICLTIVSIVSHLPAPNKVKYCVVKCSFCFAQVQGLEQTSLLV